MGHRVRVRVTKNRPMGDPCHSLVGVGQSDSPFTLTGSIDSRPSCIINPKYSVFVLLNSHFFGFRNRSLSRNRCSTNFVIRSSSS